MIKLEKLMSELCPEGVEYKKLKNVSEMKRGTSITKKDIIEGTIPVISGGREPAYYCDKFNRDGKTITIAGSGANAGYVQYWTIPIFVCDAFSIKGNDCVDTKFLYYYLLHIQEYIYSTKKGGGVPHVHISSIENVEIPVPPLPIQEEIVRILDNFTELTTKLTMELATELTTRKQQYEYYRDKLLTFDDGVEYKKIGSFCKIQTGQCITNKDTVVEGLYPVISGGLKPMGYYNSYNRIEKTVTIARAGSAGYVKFIETKFYLNDKCFSIVPRDLTNTKYLYYALKNMEDDIVAMKSIGSVPTVNTKQVASIEIPVPPIPIQIKIVNILDKFDAYCNDLTQGLPAEIETRQKQYEFYRNKLLNFKRIN